VTSTTQRCCRRHDPSDPYFGVDEHDHVSFFTAVNPKAMSASLKAARERHDVRVNASAGVNIEPGVFLAGESDLVSVVREFSLNKEQTRAFRIICNHALGIHPTVEPHLLMGVFGEGGTGKSRLIEAVRVWFERNNRGH